MRSASLSGNVRWTIASLDWDAMLRVGGGGEGLEGDADQGEAAVAEAAGEEKGESGFPGLVAPDGAATALEIVGGDDRVDGTDGGDRAVEGGGEEGEGMGLLAEGEFDGEGE